MTRDEMKQIATPRTDGVHRDLEGRREHYHVRFAAMTNLARQLERELIVARREILVRKIAERCGDPS